VLSQKLFTDEDIVSPGWWANDSDFPQIQNIKGRANSLEPPSQDLRKGIISDLRNQTPFEDLKVRLELAVKLYENHANVTGDHYFLVRSFCNVGNVLLRTSKGSRLERAEFAQRLARTALRYDPRNPIAWGLWRDALFSSGAYEASAALGWETVLRFPNDPFMRNELAEILIVLDRPNEALVLLEDALQAQVFNFVTHSILSRLYSHFGSEEAALQAINTGLNLEPKNHDLESGLARLKAGAPLPLFADGRKKVLDAVGVHLQPKLNFELARSGQLRSFRQRLQRDSEALQELKEVLETDPDFAYAQILAARYKLWHASEHVLPPVAAAFEEALAFEDTEKLISLVEKMPRLKSLILLAQAILGDAGAAEQVANRIRNPSNADNEVAIDILRVRFQPVFALMDGGLEPGEAVIQCANQLRIAIYDTNEALSSSELLAA
jgi:tetratricopeptide (TPR) repeat protein